MNKPSQSLQTKLSLGILLMAIPIFVLSLGLLFVQSRYYIRQEASEHASSLLNTTMHQIKRYMLTVETATNSNAWLVERNFHPDSLQAICQRIVTLNRNVHSATICTAPDMFPGYGRYFSVYAVDKGDTIVSVREPGYEYFDRQWYKAPIARGESCWVEPVVDHTEGPVRIDEAVLTYSRPLYDKDRKQVVGVVCADLSFKFLKEAVHSTKHDYADSYIIMLGGKGQYFIHPDSTRLLRKSIFSDVDASKQSDIIAIGHEMIDGKTGHMHAQINGRRCYVTYRPIPSSQWSIALVCPDSEILKSYNQLLNIIIALILVGLAVILWLCRRAVGHAIRPVSYLVGMSRQISEGNYDLEIPTSEREDAIGQLQNSFATMQQSIKEHLSTIRQTTEETQQRNQELAKAMKMAEESVRQKSLFIQNMSHQIRTPLNIILGFAQVLYESRNLPESDLQEIRSMMQYNTMHLNRMVLMLFDSSDTGAAEDWKSQRTDLVSCNKLAGECVTYTQSHFPGLSIGFKTKVPDSVQIQTNHLYLMRSLRELLYNAAKYSDGQHITMSVEQTEASVRFIIEDVGPGLSQESLEKLFTPFSKIDDLSEGLGLGLSLSRRHIISLGGDLVLDPDYHDGCRFIAIVPK